MIEVRELDEGRGVRGGGGGRGGGQLIHPRSVRLLKLERILLEPWG